MWAKEGLSMLMGKRGKQRKSTWLQGLWEEQCAEKHHCCKRCYVRWIWSGQENVRLHQNCCCSLTEVLQRMAKLIRLLCKTRTPFSNKRFIFWSNSTSSWKTLLTPVRTTHCAEAGQKPKVFWPSDTKSLPHKAAGTKAQLGLCVSHTGTGGLFSASHIGAQPRAPLPPHRALS